MVLVQFRRTITTAAEVSAETGKSVHTIVNAARTSACAMLAVAGCFDLHQVARAYRNSAADGLWSAKEIEIGNLANAGNGA